MTHCQITAEYRSERILKIGQCLMQLPMQQKLDGWLSFS